MLLRWLRLFSLKQEPPAFGGVSRASVSGKREIEMRHDFIVVVSVGLMILALSSIAFNLVNGETGGLELLLGNDETALVR